MRKREPVLASGAVAGVRDVLWQPHCLTEQALSLTLSVALLFACAKLVLLDLSMLVTVLLHCQSALSGHDLALISRPVPSILQLPSLPSSSLLCLYPAAGPRC